MSCASLLSCTSDGLLRLALWSRSLTNADGSRLDEPWTYSHSECRDPSEVGAVRRTLTWQDVMSAIRRIGVPAGEVEAPPYTLVNLETTFYTAPHEIARSLAIIGYSVDVEISPIAYEWRWGDGSLTTTTTPGRPYPSTEVTHTYRHATRGASRLQLSVAVTYQARYRVDGGDWIDIPETITIDGPATSIPVKQASPVLVQPR
jgi:hypothetical protein